MAESRDRYPLNSEGPFYVANGECISCGVPEVEADGLISHDAGGHCFFARQPLTPDETNAAIRSVWGACCGALRYSGSDPRILTRLAELGASHQCDQKVAGTQVVRNRARFEYGTSRGVGPRHELLREILNVIAGTVRYQGNETFGFSYSRKEASFRLAWGKRVSPGGYSVQFAVTHESADRWFLHISGHEAAHTGFAIAVDKALQQNKDFRSIRWFEESGDPDDRERSKPHPY